MDLTLKRVFIEKKKIFERRMKIMKTLKNKLGAILLLAIGCLPAVLDGDLTCLLFFAVIAIPLFFSKENWFYEDED